MRQQIIVTRHASINQKKKPACAKVTKWRPRHTRTAQHSTAQHSTAQNTTTHPNVIKGNLLCQRHLCLVFGLRIRFRFRFGSGTRSARVVRVLDVEKRGRERARLACPSFCFFLAYHHRDKEERERQRERTASKLHAAARKLFCPPHAGDTGQHREKKPKTKTRAPRRRITRVTSATPTTKQHATRDSCD